MTDLNTSLTSSQSQEANRRQRTKRVAISILIIAVIAVVVVAVVVAVVQGGGDGGGDVSAANRQIREQALLSLTFPESVSTRMTVSEEEAFTDTCNSFFSLNLAGFSDVDVSLVSQRVQSGSPPNDQGLLGLETLISVLAEVPGDRASNFTSAFLAGLVSAESSELLFLLKEESGNPYFSNMDGVRASSVVVQDDFTSTPPPSSSPSMTPTVGKVLSSPPNSTNATLPVSERPTAVPTAVSSAAPSTLPDDKNSSMPTPAVNSSTTLQPSNSTASASPSLEPTSSTPSPVVSESPTALPRNTTMAPSAFPSKENSTTSSLLPTMPNATTASPTMPSATTSPTTPSTTTSPTTTSATTSPTTTSTTTSPSTPVLNETPAPTNSPTTSAPTSVATTATPTSAPTIAPTLSPTGAPITIVIPPIEDGCNGLSNLCYIQPNDMLFATMHHAHAHSAVVPFAPSHRKDIMAALQAGVRGLNLGFGKCLVGSEQRISLVHTSCLAGFDDPIEVLTEIHQFLTDNPNEVILMPSLLDEDTGGRIDEKDIYDLFEQIEDSDGMSMTDRLYNHDSDAVSWPTLNTLIEDDKRILFFLYSGADKCQDRDRCPDGIHDWYTFAGETEPDYASAEDIIDGGRRACRIREGERDSPDFYALNLFLPFPSLEASVQLNDGDFLRDRIETCSEEVGFDPNLLIVDFWQQGDVLDVVREHNAGLIARSASPTVTPTMNPTSEPTALPTSSEPTPTPTGTPTSNPTATVTTERATSASPTARPTAVPTPNIRTGVPTTTPPSSPSSQVESTPTLRPSTNQQTVGPTAGIIVVPPGGR